MSENVKNFIIFGLLALCIGLFIFGSNNYINYNKEKKDLNAKIERYQVIGDSLEKENKHKIDEYLVLQNKYLIDSAKLDSLVGEYYDLSDNANKSNKTANYWKNKYANEQRQMQNRIIYLQNHKIDIKGDSLLRSLSKKIN